MTTNYSTGIPAKNEENTIVKTLESVLNQTFPPEEIHVCVNGSTDNTYKIVKDMAKAQKNINLTTSNPGKANAWNKIVSENERDYIMFCDGDVKLNDKAAQNLKNTFEKNNELVIVGGLNAYISARDDTIFSKYFTENLDGKPIERDWISGALYMAKINELKQLANKLNVELMPPDIINEDGLLEIISQGHRQIIDSSYNLSMQVSTFKDWKITFKRILAGQKQLKERYSHLYDNSSLSIKRIDRIKSYAKRFNEIEGIGRKVGITSLFALRTSLNIYYRFTDKLDYNPVWKEAKSTKQVFN